MKPCTTSQTINREETEQAKHPTSTFLRVSDTVAPRLCSNLAAMTQTRHSLGSYLSRRDPQVCVCVFAAETLPPRSDYGNLTRSSPPIVNPGSAVRPVCLEWCCLSWKKASRKHVLKCQRELISSFLLGVAACSAPRYMLIPITAPFIHVRSEETRLRDEQWCCNTQHRALGGGGSRGEERERGGRWQISTMARDDQATVWSARVITCLLCHF